MYYCFNYFPTDLNKGHSFIQKRKKKTSKLCILFYTLSFVGKDKCKALCFIYKQE